MSPLFALLLLAADPPQPKLLATGVVSLGAPSRDGRFLSHIRDGNLAWRNLDTNQDQLLTTKPKDSPEFAYFSVPSRDAAHIAYAWFNAQGFYELRLVASTGGAPRTLYRNPEAGFVQPCAFTPDNSKILTLLFRKDNTSQITLISAKTGEVETLRSLNWVYPKRMDLSLDGRHLVYDSFRPDSKTERAIYLLALDGSSESILTPEAGSYLFPLFSNDGRSIYYFGGDADHLDLWQRPLDKPTPTRIAANLGRALPLGLTTSGLLFGRRNGASEVYTIPLDSPGQPLRATIAFPGLNRSPAFSPAGNEIAFLSRRGAENFGQESRTILIRHLISNQERDINPKLAYIDRLTWSSIGILASGSDGKGRSGVFLVDPQTGHTKPLLVDHNAPFRGYPAALTTDRTLYFLRDNHLWRKQSGPAEKLHPALAIATSGNQFAILTPQHNIQLNNQTIPCSECTELAWSTTLIAASPTTLYELNPNTNNLNPISTPARREGHIAISPNGDRLALTIGQQQDEIWTLPLRP